MRLDLMGGVCKNLVILGADMSSHISKTFAVDNIKKTGLHAYVSSIDYDLFIYLFFIYWLIRIKCTIKCTKNVSLNIEADDILDIRKYLMKKNTISSKVCNFLKKYH